MQLSGVKTSFLSWVALGMALAWVAPARGGAPEFEVLVLPALTEDGVEVPSFVHDINNLGQVAGDTWFTAFRYTPDVGMETIELGEGTFELARRINDQGDVLGTDVASRRWFLFRDETGIDLLERGLSDRRLKHLGILDMNNSGDLVGFTYTGKRVIPVLYSREDGWINLASIDPRFKTDTAARLINDAGDLVLTISRGPEPGDDPPFGRQESFILRGGETLVRLDDFGRGVNVPGDLNESGEIAGLSIDRAGREQAYVYRPELGVGKVTAGEFKEAMAGWITEAGIVGGMAARSGRLDTLFSVDTRGSGESKVVKHRRFRRLARAAGSRKLTSISVESMNDRVEFVGYVKAGKPRQSIPFFYSKDKGLHAIQTIVDAAGAELEVKDVVDVNNRGQILVQVRSPDGPSAGAILTPVP